MKNMLKETFKDIIYKAFVFWVWKRANREFNFTLDEIRQANLSFAQFGEDQRIAWLVQDEDKAKGFYVDVGAFDPTMFSNTLLLYRKGFRGINIDLDEHKIAAFRRLRPQDYNVVAAISDRRQKMKFLRYGLGTTNRICDLDEENLLSACNEQPLEISVVDAMDLTSIIEQSPFADRELLFLNVDCEGHDLAVLRSLDFRRYAPRIICVEALAEEGHNAIADFLTSKGYECLEKVDISHIYKRSELGRGRA